VSEAPRPVPLLDLPHTEARRALAAGAIVYLPVNPVEYHGPHLSLRNDHLISMGLAADLHARLAPGEPFLVASPIEAGVEPAPGPGSRGVSFRALRRLVRDACAALADLGARRVVIATFHGAPLHAHALHAGVRLLEARGARAIQPLNLLLGAMIEADPTRWAEVFALVADERDRAAVMREMAVDFHAGFGETSLALHYAPASVSAMHRDLPPCPPITPDPPLVAAARAARAAGREALAAELDFAARGRGWAALRPFPGYTGRPHLASAAVGERFAAKLVDAYAEAARAVFAGAEGPSPIMPWVLGATLGGVIPGMRVPLDRVQAFG
jgi:creatinine amidohydrolase